MPTKTQPTGALQLAPQIRELQAKLETRPSSLIQEPGLAHASSTKLPDSMPSGIHEAKKQKKNWPRSGGSHCGLC